MYTKRHPLITITIKSYTVVVIITCNPIVFTTNDKCILTHPPRIRVKLKQISLRYPASEPAR